MSYDISIGKEDFNYTYNVAPMWYDCYEKNGIREFYDMTGRDSLPVLRKLRNHMEDNADRLREMNPENGWGSFDGALAFVNKLIVAAMNNPEEIWEGD
jgi:hypothetical protein